MRSKETPAFSLAPTSATLRLLEGAQPTEVADKLPHTSAEDAMKQSGNPFIRDDASPQHNKTAKTTEYAM